jgi:xylan 1,4-beta-xylosidase
VHWAHIGHVLHDPAYLDVRFAEDSRGVWAPDIEYIGGLFRVVYPVVTNTPQGEVTSSIWITSAGDPRGPWTRPELLAHNSGIDPALFVDDDHTVYLVWGDCRIQQLAPSMDRLIGQPTKLWDGSGGIAPEGPHIVKRDGWYHLYIAEGGTFYGHSETSARSRNLLGPYESSPYNPILHQSDPAAPIQKAGHGKLVEDTAGGWWMLHLAGRPVRSDVMEARQAVLCAAEEVPAGNRSFCPFGRESFLSPVEWTPDEWFFVAPARQPRLDVPVSPAGPDPNIETSPGDVLPGGSGNEDAGVPVRVQGHRLELNFRENQLGVEWQWVRNPHPSDWRIDGHSSSLWLRAPDTSLSVGVPPVPVVRVAHPDFSVTTEVQTHDRYGVMHAGLVLYFDRRNHIIFGLRGGMEPEIVVLQRVAGMEHCIAAVRHDAPPDATAHLRICSRGVSFAFQVEVASGVWRTIIDAIDGYFMSHEGVHYTENRGAFTGLMAGMVAVSPGSTTAPWAQFSSFVYEGAHSAGRRP